ncbi:hypothetical protein SAMN02787148_11824 [Burkholderia vietnamiensis]|jgi:hypothetical protein|nr:hypothetical protein AK36_1541 [Burkholderia vietnamiensis LMG 10929]TCT27874.1 hypothetical protein EC918_111128 [Burkholderia vietnamiensis]SCZ40874.1 hypothetical protein SAMN02787148_11824 [Burkholderia vietnamiensis]SFY25560.1 hypothetical protein SAMN02787160_11825 [Burkholderia vietnamiensis]
MPVQPRVRGRITSGSPPLDHAAAAPILARSQGSRSLPVLPLLSPPYPLNKIDNRE